MHQEPATADLSPQRLAIPRPKAKKDTHISEFELKSTGLKRANSEVDSVEIEYDEDQVPPNIHLARIHGRATKVYAAVDEGTHHAKKKVCICCGNGYDLKKLSLCCSTSKLYHLGVGFPMFFNFVLFGGILILIMLAVSGVYNVVTNCLKSDCENVPSDNTEVSYCYYNRVQYTSLINKRFSALDLLINDWLNLGAVALMVLCFQLYRRKTRLITEEVSSSMQTPADFALVISNLPKDATDNEVIEYFEKQLFPKGEVKVAKVIRGYNIGKYIKLQRKKAALQVQLNNNKTKHKDKVQKEYSTVKSEIEQMEKESGKGLELSTYTYVIFEREEYTYQVLRRLNSTSFFRKILLVICCCCFNGIDTTKFRYKLRLYIARAPEPSDVIWENLGTSYGTKVRRRIVSLIFSIIVILVCGGIIVGINFGNNRLKSFKDQNSSANDWRSIAIHVLSVLIAGFIIVLNNSLNISTRKFAAYENHSTYTKYFVSVAQRLSFALFINTAITILVTDYILELLWSEGGLLTSISIVFLIAVILGPLMNLLNPWYFLRQFKRWKIKRQGAKCKLTQKQANALFEEPQIDMAQSYAMVIKSLWLTAFYAPVLPGCLPVSLVGLFISYWTDKYLLLNRYNKPLQLGKSLALSMADFLELTPFFFAVGNLVFRYLIIENASHTTLNFYFPTIIALGVSLLHFVLPKKLFECSCSGGAVDGKTRKTYSDMRIYFNNDYAIANPIYHNEALGEWLSILEKKDKARFNAVQEIVKAEIQQNNDQNAGGDDKPRGSALTNLQNYAQRTQGLDQLGNNSAVVMAPPPEDAVFFNVPKQLLRQGTASQLDALVQPSQDGANRISLLSPHMQDADGSNMAILSNQAVLGSTHRVSVAVEPHRLVDSERDLMSQGARRQVHRNANAHVVAIQPEQRPISGTAPRISIAVNTELPANLSDGQPTPQNIQKSAPLITPNSRKSNFEPHTYSIQHRPLSPANNTIEPNEHHQSNSEKQTQSNIHSPEVRIEEQHPDKQSSGEVEDL